MSYKHQAPNNATPMKDPLKDLLIKTAAEEEEAPFRPALVGDPVKFAKQTKPFKLGDAAMSGAIWMAGALFWGQMMNWWNGASIDHFWKRTDPYKGLKNGTPEGEADYKKAWDHDKIGKLARLLSAGAAGFASSAVDQAIGGQPYNYMGYKVPTSPRDVVIAFSGAGSGPHRAAKGREHDMDIADLDSRYGKGRYALFNHKHLREAQEYLLNLPPGCRIRIQGHSFGGTSAWKLAQFASDNGIPIDRLDTLDPVGISPEMQFKSKPELVKKWENHLPRKRRLWYWPDLLATMGHARRELHGAENKIYDEPQYNDHSGIRLVDFAGDKKRNLQYDMGADKPLSAFTEQGLLTEKAASDWKDWYQKHNVGVNAAVGGLGTGAATTLLHRLLTDPGKRNWRRDFAYGIPAGITGGAVAAGSTAVNNLVKSLDKNGNSANPLTNIGNFMKMLMNKEARGKWIKDTDEQIAEAMASGKGMKTFLQKFSEMYDNAHPVLRGAAETLVYGAQSKYLKEIFSVLKYAKDNGIDLPKLLSGLPAEEAANFDVATLREWVKGLVKVGESNIKEKGVTPPPDPKSVGAKDANWLALGLSQRLVSKYTDAFDSRGMKDKMPKVRYNKSGSITPESKKELTYSFEDIKGMDKMGANKPYAASESVANGFGAIINKLRKMQKNVISSEQERIARSNKNARPDAVAAQ